MPLGGFATSRSPLAAVAACGAVDNINGSHVAYATILSQCQRMFVSVPLLCIGKSSITAIEDFETGYFYSPLRGNMGAYVLEWQCKGSLSSTRSPGRSCVLQSIRGTGEIVSE